MELKENDVICGHRVIRELGHGREPARKFTVRSGEDMQYVRRSFSLSQDTFA